MNRCDIGMQDVLVRLSRGLRNAQWVSQGACKPRARLARRSLDRHHFGEQRIKVRRYARGDEHRPRPALSRARPGSRLRGKSLTRFNITGCSVKCRQSRAGRAWCPHRCAPCGFTELLLCLAPRRVCRAVTLSPRFTASMRARASHQRGTTATMGAGLRPRCGAPPSHTAPHGYRDGWAAKEKTQLANCACEGKNAPLGKKSESRGGASSSALRK